MFFSESQIYASMMFHQLRIQESTSSYRFESSVVNMHESHETKVDIFVKMRG
jgi:hypothetical protein